MTPIDEVKGLGAARKVAEVEPTGGAEAISEVKAAEELASSSAVDPLTALFDAVAERLKAGEIASEEAALESAVSELLAQQMPFVDGPTRAALSAKISAQLWSHPEMGARVRRLLR